MTKKLPPPTEDQEQEALLEYLGIIGARYYHPPQEQWTTSYKQKSRNKRMGSVKGYPDLIVLIPVKDRAFIGQKWQRLEIELKRREGSKTSPEQLEWIQNLNDAGTPVRVCKGAMEAINFIKEYL